jgi:hypothetical protein
VRAAWLWAGPQSVVTGPAAAYWHRMLDHAPAVIDLTVPASAKPRPQRGIRLRRRDLHLPDVERIAGIRLAAKPLAVPETAVALPDGSVFLDRALQKHVRFPAVYRCHCRNMGRAGSSAAGRLLTASADRADSAAERLFVALLRQAGIDGWVLGHPVGPYRIDLAFPRLAWRSRWTAGRGTSIRNGSATTVARATSSRASAGTCCGSPGTTSTADRPSPSP